MYNDNDIPLWKRVKEKCDHDGLWLCVFEELIPHILGPALNDFTPQKYGSCKTNCPQHRGESGKAYGLLRDAAMTGASVCNSCGIQSNGFNTIQFCTGWDFRDTVKYVAGTKAVALLKSNSTFQGNVRPKQEWIAPPIDMEAEQAKEARNQRIISQCISLDSPKSQLAWSYFGNRGISLSDIAPQGVKRFFGDVLYHPKIGYWAKIWDHDKKGFSEKPVKLCELPALVSKIRQPDGLFANLHITYISGDGCKPKDFLWHRWCELSDICPDDVPDSFRKKYQPDCKKLRGRIEHLPISGGGLHLGMPSEIMAVAEGLENIASFSCDFPEEDLACWGLLNASMMGQWMPPQGVKAVLILADHDPGGLKNAVKLKTRLAEFGIFGYILTPYLLMAGECSEKDDWNDWYQQHGYGAFKTVLDDEFMADLKNGTIEQISLPDYAYE